MGNRIYLDHAATTPMLPEAIEAVADGMRRWANPSSPHAEGRAARAVLEDARARIKAALGWDGELIFTSGASESIALALRGRTADETIVSSVEHDAVLRVAEGYRRLSVGSDGLFDTGESGDLAALLALDAANPVFVVQHANSETGVLQPIDALNAQRRAADRPTTLLCDCSQTAGKLALPDADMIVVAAHKLGGPPGIGALLVRSLGLLSPSGGQERGYRGGTENLPGALGFAAALEASRDWFDGMHGNRTFLDEAITNHGGQVIAAQSPRIPTIAAYRMPGVSSAAQLIRFDSAGFAVSAGSACSSGSMRPSHVLEAMGIPREDAAQVVRVSFGHSTTRQAVEAFAATWIAIADEARHRAA